MLLDIVPKDGSPIGNVTLLNELGKKKSTGGFAMSCLKKGSSNGEKERGAVFGYS
jgi:hypothetical protein